MRKENYSSSLKMSGESDANGSNGMDQEKQDVLEGENLEHFNTLVEYGISKPVAKELIKVYETGKFKHADLDKRALDALKDYSPDDAILVLKEISNKNLEHVSNKSAFLCGQMRNFKAKSKSGATGEAKGPDQEKLQAILDRTGYQMDVTTGQRKYGGPPPGWGEDPAPGSGCEVFCGKIPREMFEDELIPLFEECGRIWDLRLMMDPVSGLNRGYCFVTYCEKDSATKAVKQLDGYEIKKGKRLKLNISIANLRLFVGNIPKNKTKDEIKEEFGKRTEGLKDVIIYGSADNVKMKNRGFAFLEFDSHKNASSAKRRLMGRGGGKVWQCDIIVDWADPQEEPDEDTMSKVKVLYVRNLTSDVTEDQMKEKFGAFGKVDRVKKIKDYGFVHFEERDDAITAMETLNGEKIGNLAIDISLAKPPSENKKKEQRKHRDPDRNALMRDDYHGWDDYYGAPPIRPPLPPPRGMRRLPPPPPIDPYYDDYYFEDDYYYGAYAPLPPLPPLPRSRGPYSPPPMRLSRGGGLPPRGPPVHGAAGGMRGGPGARGRGGPRGAAGSLRGGRGGGPPSLPRGGKRKAGSDFNQSSTKRRNTQGDAWGNRPIAQQPLDQTSYGGGAYDDYAGNDAQWYQDSFGQNWA